MLAIDALDALARRTGVFDLAIAIRLQRLSGAVGEAKLGRVSCALDLSCIGGGTEMVEWTGFAHCSIRCDGETGGAATDILGIDNL